MDYTPTSPTTPGERPRPHSRGISFRSDKSGGSDKRPKLVDSPREKANRDSIWKGNSKANPNAAINEIQPGVRNVLEQSTLQPLREFEHRDASGNIIADPDRSNPTRPRMERPLDTIRNFERAIDDGYRRRTSYMRQDSETWDRENQFASRRSSYFGGSDNGHGPGPHPNANRPAQGGGYYGAPNHHNGPPPRARYASNRMQSDPQLYGHRPYPQHGYHQSHDTVNTGMTNGSDSTGPWANSTDPSSENSSLDRVNAMNKPPTPMDPYGGHTSNGYNGTIMEEQSAGTYGEYWAGNRQPSHPALRDDYGDSPQNGFDNRDKYGRSNSTPQLQQYNQPQQYQPQQPTQARPRIQLGGAGGGGSGGSSDNYHRAPVNIPPQTRAEPEKRQSWLKRRFSKKT